MITVGWILVGMATALVAYTFVGYPALLGVLALVTRPKRTDTAAGTLPFLTVTVPAHNEERQIRQTVESLLALDYPANRRQILVVSDASTDRTDEIVREYEREGVELVRLEPRQGKGEAENRARPHIRGDLVLNTDASIRIEPSAPRRLVARFRDPEVGVASGRDVSVAPGEGDINVGESGYVDYEMRIRDLETRCGGIVGASGCLYVIRRELHMEEVPGELSRDFAAALVARERGYRAVSVPDAVCVVPRAGSLRREYCRKVRTVTRGMATLLRKRHLLNPMAHPLFAWKLLSHKVCRWAVPWAGLMGLAGLAILSTGHGWAGVPLAGALAGGLLALGGWHWPEGRPAPRWLSVPAYAAASNVAIFVATLRVLIRPGEAVWEPTRREVADGTV